MANTLRTILKCHVPSGQQALEYLEGKRPELLGIPVVWNGRLRRTAGRAHFNRPHADAPWAPTRIELSTALQKKATDLRRVVLHEVGHLVAGRSAAHGPRWVVACRTLGLADPTRVDFLESVADTRKLVSYCTQCKRGHWAFRYYPRNRIYGCKRCGEVVATDPAVLQRFQREGQK
jgi:predicted SprT family Zn-dependent metalloprotease